MGTQTRTDHITEKLLDDDYTPTTTASAGPGERRIFDLGSEIRFYDTFVFLDEKRGVTS